MAELIYNKLENRLGEMKTLSREETAETISPEAKKYFDGFGDKIVSIKELGGGMDSTVFIVKLREFENRSQLVKVYDELKTTLGDKNDLVPILKKYFEICRNVREFLKKESNPLKQEIVIGDKKYSPEFSVASNGILIEKNGEIGSWIRDWVPEKNFSEVKTDFLDKIPVHSCVREVCKLLTSEFGYDIQPSTVNYKVFIDEENKIIKIVFTDLADFIPKFIRRGMYKYY